MVLLRMATYRDDVKRIGDKIGMGCLYVHNNEEVQNLSGRKISDHLIIMQIQLL